MSKRTNSYYFDYFVSALFFFSTTILVLNILANFSIETNYLALTVYIICTLIGIVALKLLTKKTGQKSIKKIIMYSIIIAAFSEIMLSFVYNTFFSPVLTFGPMITASFILILIEKISRK
ncbi:MAG: hypothetical protein N3F64_06435 [Nitrososphaeria archaeon]|nr:hypothetical protein [Nitrososphaeria archaeon]